MMYQLCIDSARPGRTYEYLARFKEAVDVLPTRDRLKGCWTTDDDTAYSGFGKLNQVLHLWEGEAPKLTIGGELLVEQSVETLKPAPFMTAVEPQAAWCMYELAIDTVEPGSVPKVLDAWAAAIREREAHGPLAGCWTSESNGVSRIFHLWGSPGLRNRERIRNRSFKKDVWPPARQYLLAQESSLIIPAVFAAEPINEEYLARDLATSAPTYVPGPSSNIPVRRTATS